MYKTVLILFVFFSNSFICCDVNDSSNKTQEEELSELVAHHEYILSMVTNASCTPNSTCEYVALGSKPCGGPKSYLAYPSSMDTKLLLEQVAVYNLKEDAYNKKWSIISDCMAVAPPFRVDCINNKCVAVYNN